MDELLALFPEVKKYFVHAALFIGSARIFFKPLQVIFGEAVEIIKLSPSKKDDELLAKVVESKFYKLVKFLIDYVFSVKVK